MAPQFVCTSCNYLGNPKKIIRGSFLIELVLWLCIILPGLIYSIWRRTGEKVCPRCKKPTMIPTNTPMGKKLLKTVDLADNEDEPEEGKGLKMIAIVIVILVILGFIKIALSGQ